MPLSSFFKRAPPAAAADSDRVGPPDAQARARARHRLIGATVLVLVAVAGLPVLFDSQPRPLPADVHVQVVKGRAEADLGSAGRSAPVLRETESVAVPVDRPGSASVETPVAIRSTSPSKPLPPPANVAAGKSTSTHAAAAEPASPASTARRSVAASAAHPPARAEPPLAERPSVAVTSSATGRGEDDRARALLEGREPTAARPQAAASTASSTVAGERFIVQVGAFADVTAAREVRAKVEHAGLKTYTQVVESPAGRRIRVRVGPFTNRADADRAAGKLRQAGLSAAILTL